MNLFKPKDLQALKCFYATDHICLYVAPVTWVLKTMAQRSRLSLCKKEHNIKAKLKILLNRSIEHYTTRV